MNRRELLIGLAAGGLVIAGELWIPGQKLISIPTKKVITLATWEGPVIYGSHPKPLWPGVERWFYDKYKMKE